VGIVAARQGWRQRVPGELAGRARTVTLVAGGLMFSLLAVAGARDAVEVELLGGTHPLAIGFSLVEAVLVIFGPVWLLAVAQRRLRVEWTGGAELARSAFGAFILQTPVLIGLAMALRGVDGPAEVKAVVVAGGGVLLSYGLAHVMITRVPGAAQVL
jgi:hypothetical protein